MNARCLVASDSGRHRHGAMDAGTQGRADFMMLSWDVSPGSNSIHVSAYF